MVCVRASGASGSSRKQPETTHEVPLRELEVASHQHKNVAKSLNILFHALAVGTAVAVCVDS